MKNIGSKLLILILFLWPLNIFPKDIIVSEDEYEKELTLEEIEKKDSHIRMLEILKEMGKINFEIDSEKKESFTRRGEIVFFIAFGYTWMYQFILYDQVLSSTFSEGDDKGELVDRNFYFAIATSLVMALFISRNDLQLYTFKNRGRFYSFPGIVDKAFKRQKEYNWYFNVFSWEF